MTNFLFFLGVDGAGGVGASAVSLNDRPCVPRAAPPPLLPCCYVLHPSNVCHEGAVRELSRRQPIRLDFRKLLISLQLFLFFFSIFLHFFNMEFLVFYLIFLQEKCLVLK